MIRESSSTRDRLETTGILKPETARDLGVVGIAGRASGFDHDLRRDFPHAAYDQVNFTVPVYQEGDVLHRMQVRIDEVRESLSHHRAGRRRLPAGPMRVNVPTLPADAGRPGLRRRLARRNLSLDSHRARTTAWPAARSRTRRCRTGRR